MLKLCPQTKRTEGIKINLIQDKWLAVKRANGEEETIRPCDITSNYENNPIVCLNYYRPDYQGAMYEFLIGLTHTLFRWSKNEYKSDPPTPELLQQHFLKAKSAFNVEGEGPLFCQDLENLLALEKFSPIGSILIDGVKQATIDNNTDIFKSRYDYESMTLDEAAVALYTLQQYAPQGGVGYRTSLRGGSPLVTLKLPYERDYTLWDVIMLNLPESNEGEFKESDIPSIFPWMTPTVTSNKHETVHPEDYHPHYVYWSNPWRLKLNPINGVVRDYVKVNYGANYPSDKWRHPLTPYYRHKEQILPMGTPKDDFSYVNWLDVMINRSKNLETTSITSKYRMWCFGYEMKNATAKNRINSITPVYDFSLDEEYKFECMKLVVEIASDFIKLYENIYKKHFKNHAKKFNYSILKKIAFKTTEHNLYATCNKIFESEKQDMPDIINEWADYIRKTLLNEFKRNALRITSRYFIKSVTKANFDLRCSLYSKKKKEEIERKIKCQTT